MAMTDRLQWMPIFMGMTDMGMTERSCQRNILLQKSPKGY